ncbi:ribonuclease E/G [Erythrobacter sp. MTPC3]|uniref:ribonuclease E/G n=1 Tax=Erythrobacter sp. MTPC3 TaxID=3056564 RepID=UPI0036F3FCC5
MADWLIERGIGEERALLVENGDVIAAKLRWPGELYCGKPALAKLVSKQSGSRRGLAVDDDGNELLIDKLPANVQEGQSFGVQVTRAAIAERGRLKRATAQIVNKDRPAQLPDQGNCFALGANVHRFPAGLWDEVWSAASSGSIAFAGGEILVSTTPAMTVIDIDGDARPRDLALAAIPAIAQALRWFDIGGSVGIDFPSIAEKAGRKEVDSALENALGDWPHERTAMNGFGFVQLVARLEGPSLLHRFAASRTGMCARMALCRAEMAEGAGAVLLVTVHPALKAKLKPDWLAQLARRTGKQVRIETSAALALEASQAQIIGA